MRKKKHKRSEFAEALVRVRKERGCPSAYGFYHDNGGKKKFDFTYHYYLLIEQGLRLPSARSLNTILEILGAKSIGLYQQRNELLRLYLRELAEGSPVFDVLFEQQTAAPAPAARAEALLKSTARQRVSQIPHMTPEQYEAVNSSATALWVFQLLLQSGKPGRVEGLSHALGLPPQELQFALNMLVEQKLIQKKKETYYCKYFESDLFGPVSGMAPARANWIGEQIQKRVQLGNDEYFYPHFFMVAEDQAKMAMLGQMFSETMRQAYLLRPQRSVRGGKLISVETRIGPLVSVDPE